MGALGNHNHERFCQAAHGRLWAGEKRAQALPAAYRETMYTGAATDDAALAPNARRLANRRDVAARLKELHEFSAKLAGVDVGWAMLKLKRLVDDIEGFNLDDFLGPANAQGRRYYDLSKVPPEKMRLLSELTIEDTTIVKPGEEGEADEVHHHRKMKLSGPKLGDMVPPIAQMGRFAGWEAPKKIAATDKDGKDLSLGDIVAASMALVLERRQGAQKQAETA